MSSLLRHNAEHHKCGQSKTRGTAHNKKKNMSKSKDILLEQEQDQDKEISAVEEDLHMQLDIFFFLSS
jgi:hypothetical protein